MAGIKGTNVSATVVPFSTEDKYATHDESYGRGGYRTVGSETEMNAIPEDRRKEGMLVNVDGIGFFVLKGGVFNPMKIAEERPDLRVEVSTGKNFAGEAKMYFRIFEVVENGYVQFVRKRKNRINLADSSGRRVMRQRVDYAVKDLNVNAPIQGVDVSSLTPGEWYEFPLDGSTLVKGYEKESVIEVGNGETKKRTADVYKFTGSNHAAPLKYVEMMNASTVLRAGLQYNVLESDFLNKVSGKKIFKIRGEVVKVNVRLTVRNKTNYKDGYKLLFAVQ